MTPTLRRFRRDDDPEALYAALRDDGAIIIEGLLDSDAVARINDEVETAVAAAFDDPRFAPLQKEEYSNLEYEISVLSPLSPIDAEDVEVGKHGLVITYGSRRGLLLPQVPTEHGWDREKFLEQTCIKAGLPSDAWEHGAKIEAFTAEIFSDKDLKEKRPSSKAGSRG